MSNKSGTAEQVISLPKGGGELKGMGESFSPNPHTGTGNFGVPIVIPKGRNGFQPELSLSYSTGNGNSCYGLGWQLNIPQISRKTSKGIPRYQGKDTFLLSGLEDLLPVDKGNGENGLTWTQYRPRTEGLFAIIKHWRGNAVNYWEVKNKDGLVSYYGTSPFLSNYADAIIYDPEATNKIFSWHLVETRDTFGNRVMYEYERDLSKEGARHWNQLYLQQIKYIDFQDPSGNEQFLASVEFNYDMNRQDSFSVYSSGFEVRTTRLCKNIVTYTHPSPENAIKVKSYDLQYEFTKWTKTALLKSIKMTGHDEDAKESLPPLSFGYTGFHPKGQKFTPVSGEEFPTQSLSDPETELIDLSGNGLPDIIQTNGVIRYWKNKGNGNFDYPRVMSKAPSGLSLANPGFQLMDANGEGRVDLFIHQEGISGYFPTNAEGEWEEQTFIKHQKIPAFSFQDPSVKLLDLNGDGITDALRSGHRMECYLNDPVKGWDEMISITRQRMESFPDVDLADPRVRLADMTGDRLQDIVFIHGRSVVYWPNMGYGKWGKRLQMISAPQLPSNYDPRRLLMGDIAGNGAHDLIYIDQFEVLLWINQNGNGFSDPITIRGIPPMTDVDAVRLVDLFGTGMNGILWSSDKRSQRRENYFFLDLTEGVKPFVLNEMNNHIGAITKVSYKPSTYYYQQDEQQVETRWKTSLPFPVQVVSKVEVIDEISKSKLVTEYNYRHGYWDGAEREFRGFGRVEQIDTQTFEQYHQEKLFENHNAHQIEDKFFSPPTKMVTWFHQGPVGPGEGAWDICNFEDEYWKEDPEKLKGFSELEQFLSKLENRRTRRDALRTLRGSVLRTELYSLDDNKGIPWTVSESVYGVKLVTQSIAEVSGTSGAIFFPTVVAQRSTNWERGHDPMTQFSFSEDYDEFGNSRRKISISCPRGWQTLEDVVSETNPFLVTISELELAYSNNEFPYIKGLEAKSTSYEILQKGDVELVDIKYTSKETSQRNLLAQSIIYYDGDAFVGLPFGQVGVHGVPVRTERIIITDEILKEVWRSEDGSGGGLPPYLKPEIEKDLWAEEYPEVFKNNIPNLAGFTLHDGTDEHSKGYWTTNSAKFDFQDVSLPSKGLLVASTDALGRQSTIEYDQYHLLSVKATNPIGLSNTVENDYRLFEPCLSIDPNDNVSIVKFSPLGFVVETYLIGKEGKEEGDGLDRNDTNAIPSRKNEYDLLAWKERRAPIWVKSTLREHHLYDKDVPDGYQNETITSIEFSDGFGRVIQTRTQAEDVLFKTEDDLWGNELLPSDLESQATTESQIAHIRQEGEAMNVIVSGWKRYDNKGQQVVEYEPFYSQGFSYGDQEDAQKGQKIEQYYDPLGRVIRMQNPDGSIQMVVFGVPENIDNPEEYLPSPWEVYTYDANDNAYRTGHQHQVDALHWNTPSSIEIDALGRTIKTIARNGKGEEHEIITHSTYDIRGNLLTVTDALGRIAFQHVYDLTYDEEKGSQVWRTENIDAGINKSIFNALGLVIEQRDSKDCLSLQVYDELNRLTSLWARDGLTFPMTLRQKLIYSDEEHQHKSPEQLEALKLHNQLGNILQHYDEAGRLTTPKFDFKGNLLISERHTLKTQVLVDLMGKPEVEHLQIDWDTAESSDLLEETGYQIATTYDALNRPKQIVYPEDIEGGHKIVLPMYNRAGALERIEMEGNTAGIHHIAYNARGQRTLIAYSNGLMTRYAYDKQRFWLKRLRTEKYDIQAAESYIFSPSGGVVQDYVYTYDLMGNITRISHHQPNAGVANTALGQDALDKDFTYDPIYRLIHATGREHAARMPSRHQPWLQSMLHTSLDSTATRTYARAYTYDKVGNLLEMKHQTDTGTANFTRSFTHQPNNNQLKAYQQAEISQALSYDANGNLIQEGNTRYYHWNHADQLHTFSIQTNSSISVEARYVYDAAGERVKKIVRKGAKIYSTTYIGGLFEHHQEETLEGEVLQENNDLHLIDDQERIALIRIGNSFDANDHSPSVQYQLGDHLGNVDVVVDEEGKLYSREEHYPYGGSSFGGHSKKRYRFTGKERDEESGLNYHSARYYAPWMKKWISADPAGMVDGVNLYGYVKSNPLIYIDSEGTESIERQKIKKLEEAAGQISNQKFTVKMIKSKRSFNEIKKIFKNSPERILSNSKATFKPVKELVSRSSKKTRFIMRKGANIDIELHNIGPNQKAPVRVIDVKESKDSFSMTFATLEEHVEAGKISFTISKKDSGEITFHINGISRVDSVGAKILYHYVRKEQIASWKEVLDNFVKISGGVETDRKVKIRAYHELHPKHPEYGKQQEYIYSGLSRFEGS